MILVLDEQYRDKDRIGQGQGIFTHLDKIGRSESQDPD
jgi:hypothetical protein